MPDLARESQAGYPSRLVAGCDEVGRGCIAGPVVAAAVIPGEWEEDPERRPEWLSRVTDSKALSQKAREGLVPLIQGWARAWAVAEASVEEIDRINIFQASMLAMERALEALVDREGSRLEAAHVLVDGSHVPRAWKGRGTSVVKGDLHCLSIACASILAKVHRDHGMVALESSFPGYEFAQHKGYGTPAHLERLRALGPTPIHRRSFAPVSQLSLI